MSYDDELRIKQHQHNDRMLMDFFKTGAQKDKESREKQQAKKKQKARAKRKRTGR